MSISTIHETAAFSDADRFKPLHADESPRRRMRWTHADYHKLIDAGVLDGKRVELWDGEIVEEAR